MSAPTIAVCGFGRCGSSLVMQMLAAGGVPCLGEFPAFEDDLAREPMTAAFASACAGRAVKLLDPQRVGLPPGARVIWLDRDTAEQAKSFAKFLRMVAGRPCSRDQRRSIERGLFADRREAMRSIGGRQVLKLCFEQLLAEPAAAASQLGAFTDWPAFNAAAAAGAVRHRTPRCAPDMAMELRLLTEATQ